MKTSGPSNGGNSLWALGGTRGNDKVDEQRSRYGHTEDKAENHG